MDRRTTTTANATAATSTTTTTEILWMAATKTNIPQKCPRQKNMVCRSKVIKQLKTKWSGIG